MAARASAGLRGPVESGLSSRPPPGSEKIWEGVSEPFHHYASWNGVSTAEFPQSVQGAMQHIPCHFLRDRKLGQMNQEEVFRTRKEATLPYGHHRSDRQRNTDRGHACSRSQRHGSRTGAFREELEDDAGRAEEIRREMSRRRTGRRNESGTPSESRVTSLDGPSRSATGFGYCPDRPNVPSCLGSALCLALRLPMAEAIHSAHFRSVPVPTVPSYSGSAQCPSLRCRPVQKSYPSVQLHRTAPGYSVFARSLVHRFRPARNPGLETSSRLCQNQLTPFRPNLLRRPIQPTQCLSQKGSRRQSHMHQTSQSSWPALPLDCDKYRHYHLLKS